MKKDEKYILFKQNSELETLVSAAIVFVVVSVNDIVIQGITLALNNNIPSNSNLIIAFAFVALYLMAMLPMSIIIHFLFRIYWLSLVGLKSVFSENTEALDQYTPYFQKRIARYQALERQIEKVDKISSSLFSFTILSLFAFCFSFIAVFGFIVLLPRLGWIGDQLTNLLLLLGVLYAIDFLSLGRIKRIKWKYFQAFYKPVYWFFSVVTLAVLYRGIYYTLIHNVPRRIIGILIPIYAGLSILMLNLGFYTSEIYPTRFNNDDRGQIYLQRMYADKINDKFHVEFPFIDSEVIGKDQNYITLRVPLTYDLEDSVLTNKEIIPYHNSGFHWRRFVNIGAFRQSFPEGFDTHENAQEILKFIQDHTILAVDTVSLSVPAFRFATLEHPERELFQTRIDISNLEKGEHILKVQLPKKRKPNTFYIPFYRDL